MGKTSYFMEKNRGKTKGNIGNRQSFNWNIWDNIPADKLPLHENVKMTTAPQRHDFICQTIGSEIISTQNINS